MLSGLSLKTREAAPLFHHMPPWCCD